MTSSFLQPPLGSGAIDRAADRRSDSDWLARAWTDDRTRVFRVSEGTAEVSGDPPRLVLSAPFPTRSERYLLGVDASGAAYFAVNEPMHARAVDSARNIRQVGALLPEREASLLVHAVALANWHDAHRFCPRCGAATTVAAAGAERRCSADGSSHFPRTDPAVIVLVTDPADRALLGRQASWAPRRFSTLAGFVEPGETAEAAVIREIFEESAVDVGSVTYVASQPWPFPSSLMLGFTAVATSDQVPVPDGEELEEVAWFSREVLRERVAQGELVLPSPISIARRLVEKWYGEAIDQPEGA
jgi:NAD+ diphosphatase